MTCSVVTDMFMWVPMDLTSVYWPVWMHFYWLVVLLLTCLNAFLVTCSVATDMFLWVSIDFTSVYWHVWTLFYWLVVTSSVHTDMFEWVSMVVTLVYWSTWALVVALPQHTEVDWREVSTGVRLGQWALYKGYEWVGTLVCGVTVFVLDVVTFCTEGNRYLLLSKKW